MIAPLRSFCCFAVFALFHLSDYASLYAQDDVNIVIAAAIHKGKCGGISWDYLGYVYCSGSGLCSDLRAKAASDAYKLHPGANRVRVECSFGDPCVVIISAITTDFRGCSKTNYGIGFGETDDQALARAKSNLYGNSTWNKSDRYQVELRVCK